MSVVAVQCDPPATKIAIIDNDTAIAMWPNLQAHFQRSLKHAHDDMTEYTLLAGILNGTYLPMVVARGDEILGLALLEIAQFKEHKVLHCIHFAGDELETWVDDWMDTWKRVAAELRCDRISIKGREGWARYARSLGFVHSYTIMHYDILEGDL